MARTLNRLTKADVTKASAPRRYADGGNLFLVVETNGAKRWAFMWSRGGRDREISLGSARVVDLQTARQARDECLKQLAAGVDPKAARDAAKLAARGVPTFGEIADDFIETKGSEWRNSKHRDQWKMTLTVYAKPLRSKAVDSITTDDVLAVLKPIWTSKPETASRLRGRIEKVLNVAKARKLRSGDNPATWSGHLSEMLPRLKKLSRGHHKAMPYSDVPAFVVRLRERQAGSVAAIALEFTILTAARSGEVLGAKWDEVDLEAGIWTVPATRMKGGRTHRVPLPQRAVALLNDLAAGRESEFVFPGQASGKPLSPMALEMALRRMKAAVTVHGFRSSFRDWVGDETDFQREVVEAALAHAIGDETEAAYRRGDALSKRRELMTAWSAFVGGQL